MPSLPRAECPVCGKQVAVRKHGELREHYVYWPQAERDTSGRVCDGSGRFADAVFPSRLDERRTGH